MASGDLTASTPVFVDANDDVAIKAAVDALNLATVTDFLIVKPVSGGKKVMIFKAERAA